MSLETRYPLCWPEGWKRCANRERARFGRQETQYGSPRPDGSRSTWKHTKELSVNDGVTRVLGELRKMGVAEGNAIISTNVEVRLDGLPYSNRSAPRDPGVAVYWKDGKGRKKCMAVDRYDRVADNIAAIAATLDAMRAIERHGGAEILERTFLGFAQLPTSRSRPWRAVFNFPEELNPNRELVEATFRGLARQVHSDHHGGSDEKMSELNVARDEALREIAG